MKVCEKIHQIKIDFQVTDQIKRYVFVYLITGKYCYLIDAGVAGCEKVIAEYMEKAGRSMTEIKAIFLTHAHPDHIGGAAEIKRKSGCKVYASAVERNWIEDIEFQFQERPIPNFHTLVREAVTVEQTVKEGERIFLESGMTIRVLETAGHSLGSVSYILEESRVIFSGDAIPVPEDFPVFVDEMASEQSLRKILTQGRFRCCCPAWDRIYEGGETEKVLEDRIEFLRKLKACVQQVETEYSRETEEEKQKRISYQMGWKDMGQNPLFKRSIKACRDSLK